MTGLYERSTSDGPCAEERVKTLRAVDGPTNDSNYRQRGISMEYGLP